MNELYEKTSSLFKKTNQQSYLKDLISLNISADPRSLDNSRLSVSAERVPILVKPIIDVEEKPFDINKVNPIINSSNNHTLNNNIISENSILINNVDESFKSNYSNGNLHINQSMNSRLLEKIKSIKILEKELKEKNVIIENLNSKIEKQKNFIQKLSEKHKSEKEENRFKNEVMNLKNSLKMKEQENSEMKEKFQELINEYKDKITKLLENQVVLLNKIKVLDSKLHVLNEENNNLNEEFQYSESYKKSVEIQMKNLKENFEETLIDKQKLNEKLSSLTNSVKILVNQIISSKNSFNSLNEICFRINKKMKELMIEEESIIESNEI